MTERFTISKLPPTNIRKGEFRHNHNLAAEDNTRKTEKYSQTIMNTCSCMRLTSVNFGRNATCCLAAPSCLLATRIRTRIHEVLGNRYRPMSRPDTLLLPNFTI